jgi:hypothetical protein
MPGEHLVIDDHLYSRGAVRGRCLPDHWNFAVAIALPSGGHVGCRQIRADAPSFNHRADAPSFNHADCAATDCRRCVSC